ncbi:hypothetical protein EDB81DRAFT_881673 [Dactylonectria macrodidyma]|uniref:DUF7704 domain-containing protein n=1 Tax=Dactylonectria macrodidyma TaxID=307937 RepID=A0A9P9JAR1_9HYPO|nr:hypothetical protein EDB81DRAFT_881673 [Dactylonectria macrodidyma]
MAPLNIPLVYRALFLYYEPFVTFVNSGIVHFSPAQFLNTVPSTAKYAPDNKVIYDQLAATYFLIAFNNAVVLRVTDDIHVWRAMRIGILICDVLHPYGSQIALGSSIFWDPRSWRREDLVNMCSLCGPATIRFAFLAGFWHQLYENSKKHD